LGDVGCDVLELDGPLQEVAGMVVRLCFE
jgi:hypothetical protein